METKSEKIKKQRNSLLWNPHNIFWGLLALCVIAGLVWACSGSIWTAVGYISATKF